MLIARRCPKSRFAAPGGYGWREDWACRTLPCASAPYGAFSSAPVRAPSWSPPRSNCRIWPANCWTSDVVTGCTPGVRVERSKFCDESGSRASMLIVRQLKSAMFDILRDVCVDKESESGGCRCLWSRAVHTSTSGGVGDGCVGEPRTSNVGAWTR